MCTGSTERSTHLNRRDRYSGMLPAPAGSISSSVRRSEAPTLAAIPRPYRHIWRSPALSVGRLGRFRAAEPPVLLGFAPSKDSTTSAAIRGAEQPSLSTVLRVDAHRRRRSDREASRCSWRALDASSTLVFTEAEAPRIQYRHQDLLAHPDRVRVPKPRPSHRSRTPALGQPPQFPGRN